MISRIHTASLWGVEAFGVCVETDASGALPAFCLVGLPDTAVRESRERLLAALKNQGFSGIQRKVTINLSPADRRKEGSAFDLPMALGLLSATEQITLKVEEHTIFIAGELSLDGRVLAVRGALSLALFALQNGFQHIVLPAENAKELELDWKCRLSLVRTLSEAVEIFTENTSLYDFKYTPNPMAQRENEPDLRDLKGQSFLRRALEVSAAGSHNLLLIGPPGSGKTMAARRLPSLLPFLELSESLETTRIHSSAGILKPGQGLLNTRPFRSPHHTLSSSALIGGGTWPRPGEVSLAHNGVLFLDELPEFSRAALETLRQPLEDGLVSIARTTTTLQFPARFLLSAAMNPCPCGFLGDTTRPCTCSPQSIQKYRQRISGPLLDRFDIQIEVQSPDWKEWETEHYGEESISVRQRVEAARLIQRERLRSTSLQCNAHMRSEEIRKYCELQAQDRVFFVKTIQKLGLSARGHDRLLKIARTLADLAQKEQISKEHLCEALAYRAGERWKNHSPPSPKGIPEEIRSRLDKLKTIRLS